MSSSSADNKSGPSDTLVLPDPKDATGYLFKFTDGAGALALPVVAFYMIVLCNFVPEIVGCRLQNLLKNSMAAKHIVGMMLLFFLVIMVDSANADRNILRNILATVGIYVWFLMTTRCPFYVSLVVMALLLVAYMASVRKQRADKHGDKASVARDAKLQRICAVAALALSVLGFGAYMWEKKIEYGKDFTLLQFLGGTTHCRGYTPPAAQIIP